MPTVITKTIKPGGGGDYTTLQAAATAMAGDLVSADQQLILECYAGNAGTLEFVPANWTVDATRNIVVRAAAGARHVGIYSTSGKAYISGDFTSINSYPRCITTLPNYTVLEYLQMENTANEAAVWGISIGGAIGCHIRGNIIKAAPASSTNWSSACRGIHGGVDVAGSNYIYNNIVYGWGLVAGAQGIATVNHTSGKTYCYNNTVVDCDIGIKDTYNGIVAKNNLVSGGTTCFSADFGTGTGYNASSDTSAGGTGSRTSQTFTFVDASGKDYHLDAADAGAKGYGVDLSADGNLAITTDIDGDTRSDWDIGADEYASSVALDQEGFRWYEDNGSESGSSAAAAQDTNITAAAGATKRLRMLVNATGDPATKQFKLQWKKSGGSWADVL